MKKLIAENYRKMRNRLTDSTGRPSWAVSLIPFAVLACVMIVVIRIFGADALLGGSQVALLFSSGVVVAISMLVYKIPWITFEDSICDNIRSVGTAVLILLLIGAIAGSWMVSGIVPTLIYYGMKIITPAIFLFACCIISALISIMTGSSWTTIATVGVAMTGIGTALGYDTGWTAGAIISGAYFGDKISPLSDTTVLASSSSGTPLFTHIRYMMITTVPSFVIAVVVFLAVSLTHGTADSARTEEFADSLLGTFNISPWLLVVPLLTGILIAKKVPAILTLFLAAVMAGITALIAQPDVIREVALGPDAVSGIACGAQGLGDAASAADASGAGLSFRDGVKGLMTMYYGRTDILTGNAALDELISTRGMTGMLNTVFLIICAVTFGGVLTGSGMMQSLTAMMAKCVHRTVSAVA
ncbi:MAG: Na+/H+ antiporter NhaC family protein, partial [Candidatus Cryptobacteroides sp.]